MNKFKVLVRCVTFNHAPYITATMDGFCRQQTDFPFVCVIIDDASKDGEQKVISKYLHDHFDTEDAKETDDYRLILACHKENKYCNFAVYLLKYNHYSVKKSKEEYYQDLVTGVDYIALCEGDDYWTDEHKLQHQADALDANPQAMLAFTSFRIVDGKGEPLSRPLIESFPGRSHSGDNLLTLLRYGNYVMTLTTMYRREAWQSEILANCPYKMDFALTMAAALMGDFIWMPEETACYRSLKSGMVMTATRQIVNMLQDIYRYYAMFILKGPCKPLSYRQRMDATTLILIRALKKKDVQLRKEFLSCSLLAWLLLPVAYVKVKSERLKDRLKI